MSWIHFLLQEGWFTTINYESMIVIMYLIISDKFMLFTYNIYQYYYVLFSSYIYSYCCRYNLFVININNNIHKYILYIHYITASCSQYMSILGNLSSHPDTSTSCHTCSPNTFTNKFTFIQTTLDIFILFSSFFNQMMFRYFCFARSKICIHHPDLFQQVRCCILCVFCIQVLLLVLCYMNFIYLSQYFL